MTGNPEKWEIRLRRDGIKCYQNYGTNNKKSQKKFIDYTKRVIEEHKQNSSKKLDDHEPYRFVPKLYECKEELKASEKQCNFYVCKPYCIIQTDTYYAAARFNKQRVIIVCPHVHENNEQWVKIIHIFQDRTIDVAVNCFFISTTIFGIFSCKK